MPKSTGLRMDLRWGVTLGWQIALQPKLRGFPPPMWSRCGVDDGWIICAVIGIALSAAKKISKVRNVDGYCYDDKPNYCPNCGAKMELEDNHEN